MLIKYNKNTTSSSQKVIWTRSGTGKLHMEKMNQDVFCSGFSTVTLMYIKDKINEKKGSEPKTIKDVIV